MGLLGPNGCGKTTSIGMMLGLIKPTSAEILIDNKNIETFKRDEILSRINFASPYVEICSKDSQVLCWHGEGVNQGKYVYRGDWVFRPAVEGAEGNQGW